MQIPDEISTSVVFLAGKKGDSFHFFGTGFMVSIPLEGLPNTAVTYLVTARHVVDEIQYRYSGDSHVYVRINRAKGNAEYAQIPIEAWLRHTDDRVDVAATPIPIAPPEWDHIPIPSTMFITDERIETENVGVGDDLFFPGLFSMREGQERNIPIMRVGNIAAMPAERINTKLGNMRGYLVEARSIGGLSGSPVFVHLGFGRVFGQGSVLMGARPSPFYLLGMIHGHYGLGGELTDLLDETDFGDIGKRTTVNMGIGIVSPTREIIELLHHPAWIEERAILKERYLKETAKSVTM